MMGNAPPKASPGFAIRREAPDQPDVMALIDALDQYQVPLYPVESHHGVDLQTLLRKDVAFFVARDANGAAVGCGGVQSFGDYAELKRMWVSHEHRGKGIAQALLGEMERAAVSFGATVVRLETGYLQHVAIALYARAGYVQCPPFGDYQLDPNSVFMERALMA
jgi:putative acetyltransferase